MLHTSGTISNIPQGHYAIAGGCLLVKRGEHLQRIDTSRKVSALLSAYRDRNATVENRQKLAAMIEALLYE